MSKENQNKKYDGQNRCRRCDRPLKDPNANYGWWCAKLVGLDFYVEEDKKLDDNNLSMYTLTNQLERSSTSIEANIHEANYAHGKNDFIAKLQIALKECYETEYWLELFCEIRNFR